MYNPHFRVWEHSPEKVKLNMGDNSTNIILVIMAGSASFSQKASELIDAVYRGILSLQEENVGNYKNFTNHT